MPGITSLGEVRVLLEAATGSLRLDHPEGIAIHPDGSIWCGGEGGQIYRVERDGSSFKQVASTGGFCLGMAFDLQGNLFICDLHHQAVMRVDASTLAVERFADEVPGHRMRIPNFPAFDADGHLFVSDSWDMTEPGPGILRFDPDGSGEVWYGEPLRFANGLALSLDGRTLYVVETFAERVSEISIECDGSAGHRRTFIDLPGIYPDGLAVDTCGNVWVGCYQPSQILRIKDGAAELIFRDDTAHLLAHPTNIAFVDDRLVAANLGRWHLTVLDVRVTGAPLPPRKPAAS